MLIMVVVVVMVVVVAPVLPLFLALYVGFGSGIDECSVGPVFARGPWR